jgi:hypothetical protein
MAGCCDTREICSGWNAVGCRPLACLEQGASKDEIATSWGVGADRNLLVQALAR